MSFFSRLFSKLFGKKPARPGPEQILQGMQSRQDAIQAYLEAPTWADCRRLVEQHPELLHADVDVAMANSIAWAPQHVVAMLEERHAVLRRCREVGVDRAFREKR